MPHIRARKKVFKYEPFIIPVVLFYGVFFWFGSKANHTKANTWFVASFQFLSIFKCLAVLWTRSHHR